MAFDLYASLNNPLMILKGEFEFRKIPAERLADKNIVGARIDVRRQQFQTDFKYRRFW